MRDANEQVWDEYVRLFAAKRFDAWSRLWADDGRFVVAYPVGGMPSAVEGRDAILAVHQALAGAVGEIELADVRFHATTDPDVAVVEHRLEVELPGGERYRNDLISRVTFRDGQVLEVKEHYGERAHEAFLRAIGAV